MLKCNPSLRLPFRTSCSFYDTGVKFWNQTWQTEREQCFGVNTSRCCKLRGKWFNWLLKHSRRKHTEAHFPLHSLLCDSHLLWTREKVYRMIRAKRALPPRLLRCFHFSVFRGQESFCGHETAQCRRVWGYAASIISPDKLPYEQNLITMQATWIHVLKSGV